MGWLQEVSEAERQRAFDEGVKSGEWFEGEDIFYEQNGRLTCEECGEEFFGNYAYYEKHEKLCRECR